MTTIKEFQKPFLVKEFNKNGEELFWRKFSSRENMKKQINAIELFNKEQNKDNIVKGYEYVSGNWQEINEITK